MGGVVVVLLDARVWPDPGVPAPFLIGFSLLLGLFYPSLALRAALSLWATVVLFEGARLAAIMVHIPAPLPWLGHRNPYSPSLPNLAVSLLPILASAFLGAWITRGIANNAEAPASE